MVDGPLALVPEEIVGDEESHQVGRQSSAGSRTGEKSISRSLPVEAIESWTSVGSVNVLPGSAKQECRNSQEMSCDLFCEQLELKGCNPNSRKDLFSGRHVDHTEESRGRVRTTYKYVFLFVDASGVCSTSLIDLLATGKWYSTMFRCSGGILFSTWN